MTTTWVQYRIRSKWFEGNLLLFVLRLLLQEPLAEWEVLASLHRSFGVTPDEREFGKLVENLVSRGYLQNSGENSGTMNRLRLSTEGVKLLSALEKEYNAFFSKIYKREE